MKELYIPTPARVINPSWTKRNEVIASYIKKNKSILDLGCGAKDLLKYIPEPNKYIGVDYHDEHADLVLDLNNDFQLPDHEWDYIICSGLLEYLNDIPVFFSKIKNHSDIYIITFWKKYKSLNNKNQVTSAKEFENIVFDNFYLLAKTKINSHRVYVLKDKK
jgi:hypothetical protein